MSIKIIVADDHGIVREGLRSLLEKESDMTVVAEAENGRKTVELCHLHKPDVVVMDVAMPDLNGIDATRQVMSEVPRTKVLALSAHSDKRFVAEMFNAGAKGYVLKDCVFEELVRAVRTVCMNKTYLGPNIADTVVEGFKDHYSSQDASLFTTLTPRQREVLQSLAEGKTTKEIAYLLKLSVKTIETYRTQLMEKLGTHSVAELTKLAVKEGLTSLDL